jgi:hypothetical protein
MSPKFLDISSQYCVPVGRLMAFSSWLVEVLVWKWGAMGLQVVKIVCLAQRLGISCYHALSTSSSITKAPSVRSLIFFISKPSSLLLARMQNVQPLRL